MRRSSCFITPAPIWGPPDEGAQDGLKTSDFDYELPQELIAQTPLERRDGSRLMTLDRATGRTGHYHFYDLPKFLRPGDCLVLNDSRVLPARLIGHRPTGGVCEVLLLTDRGEGRWECLVRPGRKLRPGARVIFGDGQLTAEIEAELEDGKRLVLDNSTAVEEVRWTEKRYGVLSEVLVRDRTTQSVQRVVNQSVLDRGGMCRRVLTMPGKSSYQAMRYSGRFQLEQSAAERLRLELTLAGRVAAWPGDLVELNLARYSLSGVWRVLSTEHRGDGQGLRTTLELGEREITV